jgi:hypothetical protein
VLQLHYSFWLGPLLIALVLFGISRLFGARSLAAIYREKFPETPRERLGSRPLATFDAAINPANGREAHLSSTEQELQSRSLACQDRINHDKTALRCDECGEVVGTMNLVNSPIWRASPLPAEWSRSSRIPSTLMLCPSRSAAIRSKGFIEALSAQIASKRSTLPVQPFLARLYFGDFG